MSEKRLYAVPVNVQCVGVVYVQAASPKQAKKYLAEEPYYYVSEALADTQRPGLEMVYRVTQDPKKAES